MRRKNRRTSSTCYNVIQVTATVNYSLDLLVWAAVYTLHPWARKDLRSRAMRSLSRTTLPVLILFSTVHVGAQDAYTQERIGRLETEMSNVKQEIAEANGDIKVLRADLTNSIRAIEKVAVESEKNRKANAESVSFWLKAGATCFTSLLALISYLLTVLIRSNNERHKEARKAMESNRTETIDLVKSLGVHLTPSPSPGVSGSSGHHLS